MDALFLRIKKRLAQICEVKPRVSTAADVDDSYFRLRKVRKNHGRGAGGRQTISEPFQDGTGCIPITPELF
jgi:hypothetical protein